jgi:hypothetical protein
VDPITRRVRISARDGLRASVRLANAASYLEISEDGQPVAGVSGAVAPAGERFNVRARNELRIRAGNAGAVRVTVNGIGLGSMGASGAVIEWRITPADE